MSRSSKPPVELTAVERIHKRTLTDAGRVWGAFLEQRLTPASASIEELGGDHRHLVRDLIVLLRDAAAQLERGV